MVSGLTQPLPSLLQFSTQTASFSQSLFPRIWRALCLATQYNDYAGLSRLRAKELITLSTGTTQVAQKRPPKTFWTSKRPFSTSLYSAALWHVVGTARPPKMGWAPVPKQLGVPGSALHVGSEATAAPRRATSGTSWRGPRRETHHSGAAELAGFPGSKPPQTLQLKLTSPRMGAKNLKPCAGNGNRLSVLKKRPKVTWPPWAK